MSRGAPATRLPVRAVEGRILGGVCAGIARTIAVDVTLVRLAFLVLMMAWGVGVLLYLVLWLMMPVPGGQTHERWHREMRHRAFGMRRDLADWGERLSSDWRRVGRDPWPRPLGRRWMAITLLAAGCLVLLVSLGAFSWVTPLRAASLAMVAVGAGTLISMRS